MESNKKTVTSEDFDLLLQKARQGDADAQYRVAVCYDIGDIVKQDSALAVQWWEKAAEQGQPDAQRMLVEIYQGGIGAPQDPDRADHWFRQYYDGRKAAAEQGDMHAQADMTRIFLYGKYRKPDYAQAKYWYDRFVDQVKETDDKFQATDFGMRLDELKRTEEEASLDPEGKRARFRKMEADAGKGDPMAEFELADAYLYGRYVDADWRKAEYWYQKVSEHSESLPVDIRNRIFFMWGTINDLKQEEKWSNVNASLRKKEPEKQETETTPAAPVKTGRHYVDWTEILLEIGTVAAAFVFLRGVPLYNWTVEHHREISFLLKPLLQLVSIVIAVLGGGAALGLLLSFHPVLAFLGGIAGGIGGLVTVFCHDLPEVYRIAKTAVYAIAALAVLRIVITLLMSLRRR